MSAHDFVVETTGVASGVDTGGGTRGGRGGEDRGGEDVYYQSKLLLSFVLGLFCVIILNSLTFVRFLMGQHD